MTIQLPENLDSQHFQHTAKQVPTDFKLEILVGICKVCQHKMTSDSVVCASSCVRVKDVEFLQKVIKVTFQAIEVLLQCRHLATLSTDLSL